MSAPHPLPLQLRGIDHTYGRGETAVHALTQIDLDIRAGEVTLLIGPSGSGKTTLLQIMGCLLTPSSGELKLFGDRLGKLDGEQLSALRRQYFGFIFQHYNLFPTLCAWENVALALDVKHHRDGKRHRGADRERALQLLERLGLGERAHAHPAELSGGQKQRVAIARALIGAPPILLADEPTAALDGKTGQHVAALLHTLAREDGCAVVVVTHDPRMEQYGDRIIHLEDGAILQDRAGAVTSPASH